jgi:hypothetical protein
LEDPQGNPELRHLEKLDLAVTIITATLTDSVMKRALTEFKSIVFPPSTWSLIAIGGSRC